MTFGSHPHSFVAHPLSHVLCIDFFWLVNMARSLLIKYIKIINLEAIFYGPSHTNRRDNHIHTHEESGILDLDKTHLTHVRAQSTVVSTSMIIRLNSYFVNIRNFFKKIIALTFCQSNFKERKTVFFIFFHMPTFLWP